MTYFKLLVQVFLLGLLSNSYGQLGFCGGSTGDAIFTENFGNGTNYGPSLPAGTTTYTFISGAPQDGLYTLFHRTNLLSSWHNSPDHTDDATDGPNGKCFIVNANNNTSGEFYKRIVTGLCVNTTFEFSAWLLNVYNQSSNICTTNEIPINVRFEIWNQNQTNLLASGDTGNIFSGNTPIWQQKALVFTTTNETSVVLIMKNNGLGGCGNDLAIDDISFKACGELTTITNTNFPNNTLTTCTVPTFITLDASTNGSSTYFYQWQSSVDNVTWTDIAGQNSATFTSPPVTATRYFRTKIAQDIANINSVFCSTVSNVFTVNISNGLPPAISGGDKNGCSNQPIPQLSVSTSTDNTVNWFDSATGGTVLLSNSNTFTPAGPGTYYAEVYNAASNCFGTSRTPVTLTINQSLVTSYSGDLLYCSGENTGILLDSNLSGTTFSWSATATNVSGANNGSGNSIVQNLTTNGISGSVTYLVTATNNGCSSTPFPIVVNVLATPEPQLQDGRICVIGNGIFGIPPYVLKTELNTIDYTFEWFFNGNSILNANSNTYSANQIGTYGVIATNNVSGCASPLIEANVTAIPKGEQLIVTQSLDFSDIAFITIDVVGGQGPFLYQVNEIGFQTSNTFTNLSPGVYDIEVIDTDSCTNLKSTVTLINFQKYFTPNNDGFNDSWTIKNMDEKATLQIFDRYGKFVVEINAKNQSWNGTANGNALPADDYWFILKYTQNGILKEYKNHFSLKR